MTPKRLCAAAAISLALTATASCGNGAGVTINGSTGVTVGEDGRTLVVAAVCSHSVDEVNISLGREGLKGNEPNKQVGTWTLRKPATKSLTLDIAEPGPEWKSHKAAEFLDGKHYIVFADRSDDDIETTQVDFFPADLKALKPGQVRVMSGEVWELADFEAKACGREDS